MARPANTVSQTPRGKQEDLGPRKGTGHSARCCGRPLLERFAERRCTRPLPRSRCDASSRRCCADCELLWGRSCESNLKTTLAGPSRSTHTRLRGDSGRRVLQYLCKACRWGVQPPPWAPRYAGGTAESLLPGRITHSTNGEKHFASKRALMTLHVVLCRDCRC